jgi:hypothetical protein
LSKAEDTLSFQLTALKVPFEREYKFCRDAIGNPKKGIREALKKAGLKDWRFDFIVKDKKLAIEVEGVTSYGKNKNGTTKLGRHQTGAGMKEDLLKYDAAMRLGWNVYRCSQYMVKSGQAAETILILLGGQNVRNSKK